MCQKPIAIDENTLRGKIWICNCDSANDFLSGLDFVFNMTQTILMVAEKPSIADTLAKALSRGKYSSRKGVSHAVQVHEFGGSFQGHPAFIKVTSVAGHVYTTDFPPQYQNWDRTEPATLFDAEVVKLEANPKTRLPAHLKAEGKGISHLVLWLDCDREGENICYEVIRNVKPMLSNANNIWRAKFSSLVPSDLIKAYEKLGWPNENEALSVDARQEIDLKLGVAFTRYQTRFFQGKYGDLDSSCISYGPCIIPTLWFCVRRHHEIQSFQPETFYALDVTMRTPSGDVISPDWDRGRIFDQRVVHCFKEIITGDSGTAPRGRVIEVFESMEKRTRPQALDTVCLLKQCSQLLGIGPQHAMHVAERLYLQGYITYPRTETNKYSSAFDLGSAIESHVNSPYWGRAASEAINGPLRPRSDGKDVGDHPPITPVRLAHESEFDHDMWRVYELVSRHFIASISSDSKFKRIKAVIEVNDERFTLVGRRLVEPGFMNALKSYSFEDVEIPIIRKGDELVLESISVTNGKTKPPPYLSESDLLSLMERHSIGTDSSMAVHINNICERNFVTLRDPGRRLVPTKLGIVLINGYTAIDPELVTPKVRADIESQCSLIAVGKANAQDVVSHVLSTFKSKFEYFQENIGTLDSLFESSFTSLAMTGKPTSRCGKCRKFMNLIDKKPVRLYCRHCDDAYNLPSGGTVRLYKELTCPLDGFELVLISHPGSAGKSYPVCPMCYNDPPFEGKKVMNCHECPHATCKHSMASLGVCSCTQEGCRGTLCLDPESKPKWKLDCNTCNFQLRLFRDAHEVHKVTVSNEKCEDCNSSCLEIEYHKDKEGEKEYEGCIVCDPVLNEGIEGVFSRNARNRAGRPSKGKGRRSFKKKQNVDPRMTFDQF
jgi:DNA topoisomerase-3